ncbi:hypothetical protein WJX82_008947 [Trebouxia sp. C0006]
MTCCGITNTGAFSLSKSVRGPTSLAKPCTYFLKELSEQVQTELANANSVADEVLANMPTISNVEQPLEQFDGCLLQQMIPARQPPCG